MRIALCGAFDVEDCGRPATARVIEAELRRRLPDAVVTVCAPLGRRRPLALDGGRAAQPLCGASALRREELAVRFDCIVVCGEDALVSPERAAELWGEDHAAEAAGLLIDGLGASLETRCPVVWAAVSPPSDPDPETAARIRAAAPRRGPVTGLDGDVPPPTLLLPRLLRAPLLERRARLLRLMGWAWEDGPVLTVQGDGRLLDEVDAIAAAIRPLVEGGTAAVQLAVSGRLGGEQAFSDALENALGVQCRRLPAVAAIEDLAALVSTSSAFLGPPGVGLWLATALGVPAATLLLGFDRGEHAGLLHEIGVLALPRLQLAGGIGRLFTPDGVPPDVAGAVARLDRQLDELSGYIRKVTSPRAAAPVASNDAERFRAAHQARGLRLFAERRSFQSALEGCARGLEAELDEARAEAARLRSEVAAARSANDRIIGSRTWRYTQPLRDVRARIREGQR